MKLYQSFLIPATTLVALANGLTIEDRNPSRVQSAAVSLCTQYAYYATDKYEVLNNLWGKDAATSGDQCTYFDGNTNSGISWSSTWSWQGGQDNVKSYAYAGRLFTRPLLSSITSLPTTLSWSYNTTNIRANVAYDLFTSTDKDHANSSGDYELMIWLGRFGGVWPISAAGAPIATVNLGGHSFDLYFGYNGAMKVYSFVRTGGDINSFNADVKDFFNYLVSNQGFPESSQYLLIYQIGSEAFTGGPADFKVSDFTAESSKFSVTGRRLTRDANAIG